MSKPQLTPKPAEVARLLAQGKSREEIADLMGLVNISTHLHGLRQVWQVLGATHEELQAKARELGYHRSS